MGKTDEDNINVDTLCEMWAQKQRNYEMHIRSLLEKSNKVVRQLNKCDESKKKTFATQKLKLDELMIHLTEELQRLHDDASAKKRLQEWRMNMDRMRMTIRDKSQTLEKVGLTDKMTISNLCDAQDYSQHHHELLSKELQRCENLRSENLSVLIDHLRAEIKQWSKMTLQYPIVHKYKKKCYTEDQLELLEKKLDDLQRYYNNNKYIFELYAKLVKLWERIETLDEKAKEPNHFRNRGGQLLCEERERNHIRIKLPKIEEKLIHLVQDYEKKLGQPFLVYGEEIMSRIPADCYETHKKIDLKSEVTKQSVFDGSLGTQLRRSTTIFPGQISLRKTTSVTHFNQASVKGSLSARPLPDRKLAK